MAATNEHSAERVRSPLASTRDGVTRFSQHLSGHPLEPHVQAHEAVHSLQHQAWLQGLPSGSVEQLEMEAETGAEALLKGIEYSPRFGAPGGVTLYYDPLGPLCEEAPVCSTSEAAAPVCALPTTEERFCRAVQELGETTLPAVQSAIDQVEESRLLALGTRLLVLWQNLQSAYDEISAPEGGDFDVFFRVQNSYEYIRRLLLSGLTLQEYQGDQLLGSFSEPTWDGDLGAYIVQRIHDMAWVLRDTASLIGILMGRPPISESDQWRAIGLLRQHQSPWSYAYMQAVVSDRGLADRYDGFAAGPAGYLGSIVRGQRRIQQMAADEEAAPLIDVSNRLGQYQLLPASSEVRLLQPMSPQEIAERFYGRAEFWESHLLPYNLGAMQGASGAGLLNPGTVLRLDPTYLDAEFQPIFAYVARTVRRQGDAYIGMHPDETAVVGNDLRFTLTFEGEVAYDYYDIEWWVENDPIAIERDHLPSRVNGPRGRVHWVGGGDAAVFEGTAAAAGNHTVHCRFNYRGQEPIELTRVFTVMALEQKTELASHRRFEGVARYPELMLESLREELDRLPVNPGTAERRRELRERIDQIRESLSDYQNPYLIPVEAVYVSSDEQPMTIPLAISVGADRTYDFSYRGYHLVLYDLTLQGRPFIEQAQGDRPMEALRNLLREFADNAPYPRGNIRFEITPVTLLYSGIHRETVIYPTDGGTILDDVLRGLSTLALAVGVGAAVLGQAEVAVPALVISGLLAGAAGTFAVVDRLEHGQFEWDTQTALDLMDMAGALLTMGMSTTATASVRGVGRMTLLSQTVDLAQIGIMAGVHYSQIQTAVETGDQNQVYQALLNAARDGALYLIIHRATAGLRGRPDAPDAPPREQTMAGTAHGDGTATSAEPRAITAEPDTPAYYRQHHEQQVARLGTQPFRLAAVAAEPSQPVRVGTVEPLFAHSQFDAAYGTYEQTLARAGGREVGIYRNVTTGDYAVRVGTAHGVSSPPSGNWEAVLHYHPNPENVLTFRMPAPADIESTQLAALRSGSSVSEMVEHPLPGGGRARTHFTVDPANGRISIEYTGADGQPVHRQFDSLGDYQRAYFERTFYVDPDSPEYQWIVQDLHAYYRHIPIEGGGGQTMFGAAQGGRAINMPEGSMPAQSQSVQSAVQRIRAQGVPMDEPLLELYLHQNRAHLDTAIGHLERVATNGASAESLVPVGRASPRGTDVQLSDIFASTPNTGAGAARTPTEASAAPGRYEPRIDVVAEGEPTFAPVADTDRMDLARFWDDEIRRVQSDPNEPQWRQYQFRAYRDRILRGDRPTWRQTEYELQYYYRMVGGEAEVPFIHGRRADWYTSGSTRPDMTTPRVMLEAKNYRLFESDGTVNRSNLRSLIRTLRHQVGMRAEHGPAGRQQSVVIDLRGQPGNRADVVMVSREIATELGDELTRVLGRQTTFDVENIQVLTW